MTEDKEKGREEKDREFARAMAGVCLVLICVLAIPLGVGKIFGDGFGWITLAIGLGLIAVRSAHVAQKEEERKRADAEHDSDLREILTRPNEEP